MDNEVKTLQSRIEALENNVKNLRHDTYITESKVDNLIITLCAIGIFLVLFCIWLISFIIHDYNQHKVASNEEHYEIFYTQDKEMTGDMSKLIKTLTYDPPVEISTPSSAIEEKEKGLRYLESYKTAEKKTKGNYIGNFQLTAYIATGNPCADGVYPSTGWTVACNDRRLWHHKIYIEGYGTYYVHDTGGMASNVVDIFVGSYNEAIQFGRRSAAVYIVE